MTVNVAYLNADPGIPLHGAKGSSVHVRQMLAALASRVDRVTALCARVNPRGASGSNGDPTSPAPYDALSLAPVTEESAAKPELPELHAMGLNDAAEGALDELAARGRLDVIYERYSLWSVAGAKVARRWGIPWFVEVNAPLVREATRHRSLELRSLAAFLERQVLREASGVIVVSEELKRHVAGLGPDPARIEVLPNGYDARLFHPPADRGRPRQDFTVAFVGSLRPWHGLDDLVDAFARLHARRADSRLLVVGDGPLRDEVRERLERSVPPHAFRLTGAVPHHEVPSWLGLADVAVAPYPALRDFYFSPLKIFEYCAMGLPIVASRAGQVADVLEDGRSACLTPPGDPRAIEEALVRLHDDGALRARLGRAARRVALSRSWDHVAGRVVQLFESALSAAKREEVAS